eukprot:1154870-Pelagomonas_calceolata.AAC.4
MTRDAFQTDAVPTQTCSLLNPKLASASLTCQNLKDWSAFGCKEVDRHVLKQTCTQTPLACAIIIRVYACAIQKKSSLLAHHHWCSSYLGVRHGTEGAACACEEAEPGIIAVCTHVDLMFWSTCLHASLALKGCIKGTHSGLEGRIQVYQSTFF